MAKKTVSKAKANLIKKIKDIITDYGSFNTGEVEAASSPCIASIGRNTVQLAERFAIDGIDAVTYVHDREEDTDFIAYENPKITVSILKEILELAKEYKELQEA